MKFDNVVGNPCIHNNHDGTVTIIYYDANKNKITKYEHLSREDALKLPFVSECLLSMVL